MAGAIYNGPRLKEKGRKEKGPPVARRPFVVADDYA
jgi:hypothetical protein